ncbi:MAG TPA: DUF5916 domain-containing protein [Vicinamibacterales bacterium]
MPAKSREAVLAEGRSLLVLLSLVCAFGTTSPAQAQSQASVREFRATRTTRPPTIDGQLNEEVWSQAQVMSDFTQIDPDEGQPATERTEVRVLYDDHALYVGVRLFDHDTVHLGRRLSTRDGDADADRVTLYLDTMHDHLTGVMFRVSASNVQTDAVLFNDTWDDWSWNAVWESNVSIDDDGWSVELRLPLSQLRFTSDDKQTWGINVERYIRRRNEGSWLEMVPKKETGRASRMVHLTGLDGLKPSRRLELLPYTAGRAEYVAPASTVNPFNDGSRVFASAGLDMKYGLTSNLTVDATVNPDFGQVEVDPAVVNLSAFETFFEEKRAFFLEGAQIFNNFGRGGSNGNWGFNNSEPQIFYSRRIGRSPQLQPEAEFADPPTATTILGAAKLTGKTSRGWSIGLLEAITSTEKAPTETAFVRGEAVVEPMTNYAVVRLQRDIGRRAGVGMLATAVNRRINTPIVNATLPDNAYVAGADGYLFLDADREWAMNFAASGSRVDGSTSAITRLQLAPQRYYQRPDALHLHLDPNATSLSGFSGRVSLNRNSGLVQINTMLWGVSPGFESNDLGFHSNGDRAGAHGVLIWRNVTPGQWLRDRTIWVAKAYTWNFARELQSDVIGSQGRFTLVNYWNAGAAIFANRHAPDDRLTRGGPMAMSPRGFDLNGWVNTDDRKRLSLNINAGISDNAAGGWGRSLGVTFNIKPSDRFTLSTGPDWNRSYGYAQYVRSVDDPTATSTFGGRYVFGGIDQWQLTMTTRANVIFSPHASLQVYMQPLLATGDYSGFKELAQPRTHDFLRYGTDIGSLSFEPGTRMYTADPDGAGVASPFTFEDPDYNFKSLRLNAVFRWEMKPGSNFYVVWTRQQQDLTNPGHFAPARDARAMFTAPGDDIILFKLSYWLGR